MFSMEKFDHYFKWTNYYGYWYKNLYIKTFAYAKTFFTSIPVLFEFNNPLKRFSPKNQMFLCVCVCMCEDVCSASMGEGQWCPPEWGARGLRTACPLSPGTGCSAKTIGTTPQTHCLPYQSVLLYLHLMVGVGRSRKISPSRGWTFHWNNNVSFRRKS